MKFKVTKQNLELLLDQFDKEDHALAEITLEPANQTAAQAMHLHSVQNESFHRGYHYGYKEGYHHAERDRRINPFCCDINCPYK